MSAFQIELRHTHTLNIHLTFIHCSLNVTHIIFLCFENFVVIQLNSSNWQTALKTTIFFLLRFHSLLHFHLVLFFILCFTHHVHFHFAACCLVVCSFHFILAQQSVSSYKSQVLKNKTHKEPINFLIQSFFFSCHKKVYR